MRNNTESRQVGSARMTADDVAAYILFKLGNIPTMKLQKLLYYAQAWSLVWDDRPLFSARIQAWANGPVVPSIYKKHRGQFSVMTWPDGNRLRLDQDAVETIDAVLTFYGHRSSGYLSSLTHRETPWMEARGDLLPGERGSSVISDAAMAEYYGGLVR